MFINKILGAVSALAVFIGLSAPAYALTFLEVQQQLGGYTCAGSVCFLNTNGTDVHQLPDVITHTDTPVHRASGPMYCLDTKGHVHFSLAGFESGMPVGWCISREGAHGFSHETTTVTPGGTQTVPACNTRTGTLGFAEGSFTLVFVNTQHDGAC